MNGAIALPCENTTIPPISSMTSNTGISQYFFRVSTKPASSRRKLIVTYAESQFGVEGVAVVDHEVRVLLMLAQHTIADDPHLKAITARPVPSLASMDRILPRSAIVPP